MKVNGVWVPAAATRTASPTPSVASAGSSWDRVLPAPSVGTPLFLTPPGSAGALTPPGGGPDPQALELARRLLEQQAQPLAPAKSTAEVKGSTARLWGLGRSCVRYWCGRRGGLLTQWAFFLVPCMLAPAWLAPSLTRSVGGAIAQVAKNATLLVSDMAVSLTKGSMSLVQEAWSGADLAESSVNASGARFLVLKGVSTKALEVSELALTLEPLPSEYDDLLWNAISGVDQLVPHLAVSEHRFRTVSYFDSFEYEMRLFKSGYVSVRFVWARMSFKAVWANPLWEFLGPSLSPELEAIGGRTREAVSAAFDLDWLREPLSESEDELQVGPPDWISWYQLWRQQVRWALIANGVR
ncbi:unnamed protein product [Prorocentrum cordatum]|uniref:Uncharacterized protein n=1 Tax=Prorocentrum cordatum TaxID=2364126 RepID=A0ABN9X5R2_9DINO|nr:unnamed protein product [Polarella glacialis]